jgi:hypothetical protein
VLLPANKTWNGEGTGPVTVPPVVAAVLVAATDVPPAVSVLTLIV